MCQYRACRASAGAGADELDVAHTMHLGATGLVELAEANAHTKQHSCDGTKGKERTLPRAASNG
jgi:hypothetical protein